MTESTRVGVTDGSEALWRAADAVLDELLDLAPEVRARRLEALPSAELRAAVEALLAAHEHGTGPLDRARPPAPVGTALEGRRLARWVLEREIGRGGMSVVYRAHAADAPDQVVAVKLLTLGALAGGGLERFRQEQTLLARLRHAHIATLFDAGVAEDGTPWLAMALVDGVRIDVWCERQGLDTREIVRLFLDVCDAVAHAHRNLVIHRDLKPSNVLVDESGHVRLLDFGIARMIDAHVEATASQWRALTPEYAAPEQFAGAPPSTAMDVYGLGALLYRLLVGRAPRTVAGAAEAEATTPSRAAQDAQRASTLRGDLDAVLLKALALDPQRRHDGVAALQQDLIAWMEQRPVSARAPSWHYRLRRLVARHRLAALAIVAVALAVVAGVAATLWQAERASRAAARAQAEAERAQAQATRATAIKDLVLSLFNAADPEQAGGAAIDSRAMLRRGSERIAARADLAPDVRLEILTTIAEAQGSLAWYDDASATRAAANALAAAHPEIPVLLRAALVVEEGDVAQVQGEREDALAHYARAEALLAPQSSREAERMRLAIETSRGITLSALNRLDEALATFAGIETRLAAADVPDALKQRFFNGWGSAAYRLGDYAVAIEKLEAAHALQGRSGNEGNAAIVRTLNLLSGASAMIGRLDDAVRYDGESLEIARRSYPAGHPEIASAAYAYGDTLRQAGRFDEAMNALEEARAIRARVGPANDAVMVDFTRVRVLLAQGRYAEAIALGDAIASGVAESQGAKSPGVLQLANQVLTASTLHDPQGQLPRRVAQAEALLNSLDASMRSHPVTRFLRWRVAHVHFVRGDREAARRWLARAIERAEGVPEHSTNELVNEGLRLRLEVASGDAASVQAQALALRTLIENAQGASTEAIAYAWLSIASAATKAGDVSLLGAARTALVALDAQRPLPAEYAAALRALPKG